MKDNWTLGVQQALTTKSGSGDAATASRNQERWVDVTHEAMKGVEVARSGGVGRESVGGDDMTLYRIS